MPKDQIKNLAYACENTEWGSSVAKSLEGYAKEYGFTLVKGILYDAKAPDLTSEAQTLMAAKPDGMLFASYLSDSILMVRTLKGMKAAPKVFWGQNAGFEMADFPEDPGCRYQRHPDQVGLHREAGEGQKSGGPDQRALQEEIRRRPDRRYGPVRSSVFRPGPTCSNKAGSTDPRPSRRPATRSTYRPTSSSCPGRASSSTPPGRTSSAGASSASTRKGQMERSTSRSSIPSIGDGEHDLPVPGVEIID